MRNQKDVFESDPALAGEMIAELERSDFPAGRSQREIDDRRPWLGCTVAPTCLYVNYYGPPRHGDDHLSIIRALQLGEIRHE